MPQKTLLIALYLLSRGAFAVPDTFVDIKSVNSTIEVEMRYASDWNFTGRPVTGYLANKCYLTKQAAQALALVQRDLNAQKLGLLVLDCYRPTRAVAEFVRWVKDSKDQTMKSIYYPDENKADLITRGYIADKSGHSRGSTIDLTIISLSQQLRPTSQPLRLNFKESIQDCRHLVDRHMTRQLDMGTTFDCFSILANTNNTDITSLAQKNRKILLTAMEKRGFINYEKEWWHFTLGNEPFKDTSFDFLIN